MVKRLIIIPLIILSGTVFGQYFKKVGIHKATLTISPGMGVEAERFYLHGHTEIYGTERVSLRGDGYYNLGGSYEKKYGWHIENTHSIFFGALYHLTDTSAFDPYIGFQPGIAISKPGFIGGTNVPQDYKSTITPLASITAGANYFVGKYFNFFASARYIIGESRGTDSYPLSLNELRVSAGLGFNIRMFSKFNNGRLTEE